MRKFLQNKLWRDKSVETLEKAGSRITWHVLDDTAFLAQLRNKLMEEAEEVVQAKDRKEVVGELADLFEVVDAFIAVSGIKKSEILEAQIEKQKMRGSFAGRKFVEVAEHPLGSLAEQYCLADSKKYPEID
jgi:predicted house-cleaning noncanonical NTP pyrophosphatase (MazG superfamily)